MLANSIGLKFNLHVPMSDTPNDTVEAPQQQQILHVDRSEGISAARHVVLPVDDSPDSELAIIWAVENLYRTGDVFHLLHVIPEPKMVHIWAGVYVPPDDDAELMELEDTKQFVKHRFAKQLMQAQVPFQLHVIVGPTDPLSVAKVITKKCSDLHAELIVIGKHSKGKMKEYWVGSCTKELVNNAPVPVAVVPHCATLV